MITETPSDTSKAAILRQDILEISSRNGFTSVLPSLPREDSIGYLVGKRITDIVISSVAILVFAPIMVLAAMAVFLADRGPMLYRQRRVGRNGRLFSFYKFRSMRVDSELYPTPHGPAAKSKNDPRITPVGRVLRRTSMDELPQLFSVLRGHMSIIGPRPHLPEEVATYTFEQQSRLLTKPGLICLREIKGRSDLSFEEWVSLDLEYLRNRSFWLDLKIFLLAIPAVISGKGAY